MAKKPFRVHVSMLLLTIIPACNEADSIKKESTMAKKDTGSIFEKLDVYFQSLVDTTHIPGIAVAITRDDTIIYANGFGVRNLNTKDPVQANHIFHVASVSKPFAATAIVQLMERGKINLDEKLVTYLPYFRMADTRYKNVTIKQMLNHTSGFPDVNDYEWDKPQMDDGAAERYAKSLINEKLISKPGEEFHYSNMAFDVLADVVAKVSGQSFESFVKENILLPLQMTESSFFQPETKESLRTTPHTGNPPAVSAVYPYNRAHAPSSTLNSSAVQLANWAIANLHHGIFNGRSILKPESYSMMMTPTFVTDKENNQAVGLSWFIGHYKDVSMIMHSGSDLGYRSNFTMIPDRKLGIVLLANYDETPIKDINFKVLDILLEENKK
jgi:CubicO group peptidase (beta-lactamase class C family)